MCVVFCFLLLLLFINQNKNKLSSIEKGYNGEFNEEFDESDRLLVCRLIGPRAKSRSMSIWN